MERGPILEYLKIRLIIIVANSVVHSFKINLQVYNIHVLKRRVKLKSDRVCENRNNAVANLVGLLLTNFEVICSALFARPFFEYNTIFGDIVYVGEEYERVLSSNLGNFRSHHCVAKYTLLKVYIMCEIYRYVYIKYTKTLYYEQSRFFLNFENH